MGRPPKSALGFVSMSARQEEVARRLALGERPVDIAREMHLSVGTVSALTHHNPAFAAKVDALKQGRDEAVMTIVDHVQEGAEHGVMLLKDIVKDGKTLDGQTADLQLRVSVARDLLDREGSAPRVTASRTKSESASIHLTGEDLREMQRMKEEVMAQRAKVVSVGG